MSAGPDSTKPSLAHTVCNAVAQRRVMSIFILVTNRLSPSHLQDIVMGRVRESIRVTFGFKIRLFLEKSFSHLHRGAVVGGAAGGERDTGVISRWVKTVTFVPSLFERGTNLQARDHE